MTSTTDISKLIPTEKYLSNCKSQKKTTQKGCLIGHIFAKQKFHQQGNRVL